MCHIIGNFDRFQIRARIKSAVSEAGEDAKRKAVVVTNYVRKAAVNSVQLEGKTPTAMPVDGARGVKINFAALDVNNDGVVDEKDIMLLNQFDKK